MCIINYWFSPTYENPRRFSIRFVFAKLVSEIRNEIIHKTDNETFFLHPIFSSIYMILITKNLSYLAVRNAWN